MDRPEGCKVEITNDRVAKLNGYAAAGVPLYLLIDPHVSGTPTVHQAVRLHAGHLRLPHTLR